MKPSTKSVLGITSLVGVIAGVALTLGGATSAVTEQVWQKYQNQVRLTPTTTDLYIPQSDVTAKSVTIGATGTAVARINAGDCYLRPRATTIAASSTAIVECQATAAVKTPWGTATGAASALVGVSENDFVQAKLSTTTANQAWGGLDIIGASASSTQGYIQLIIQNHTGDTFTWPLTGNATGTASYVSLDT